MASCLLLGNNVVLLLLLLLLLSCVCYWLIEIITNAKVIVMMCLLFAVGYDLCVFDNYLFVWYFATLYRV